MTQQHHQTRKHIW